MCAPPLRSHLGCAFFEVRLTHSSTGQPPRCALRLRGELGSVRRRRPAQVTSVDIIREYLDMRDPAVIGLQKRYHKSYSDFINWPLTRPIALGDVGKWSSGKTFSQEENISKYGISFNSRGGATVASRALTSASGVATKFKAAGDIPPANTALVKTKAGVSLMLKACASHVLQARNLREEVVEDRASLVQALQDLGMEYSWWKHRIVVSSILKADIATVALAQSRSQRVDINATVDASVPFELVDADLGLEIGYQGEHTLVDLLATDVVLAFDYTKLRKGRWWHSWS